jgi:hypothetical protein
MSLRRKRRMADWVFLLSLTLSCGAAMQAQDAAQKKSNTDQEELPDIVEIDPFGGVSLFGQVNRGLGTKFADGGTAGVRAAWNFSKYVGLEFAYNFMENNVTLVTPVAPGLPSYSFGNRIHYFALNPVFNFTPRGSRVQPYLTGGVGAARFSPTDKAQSYAQQPAVDAIYQSASLDTDMEVAYNYGGGIKFHLTDHFGLRFDARGFYMRNARFNLPGSSTGIYVPSGGHVNGFQATLGLVFYLGQKVVPQPPPAPPPPAPLNAGSITGSEGVLCQAKAINLHSTASDPSGHALTYAWQMNGAAAGSNSPDFSFTPNNAGDFTVQVTISDSTAPSRTVTAGPVTLSVKEYVEPQITSVSATPNVLSCAADTTGTLTGNATGSACGGNLTYKWTVSEGSVGSDTSANATFDGSTLSFEAGGQGQTKTVTATFTVSDETGKSASKTTDITVKCPPQFVRLSDVVFAKNNARVNNCGKRVLIDEAAPRLAGGDYDIVLVGHRDADELQSVAVPSRRGRRRTAEHHDIDEQRVLNAAAVLSGGTGTCAKVEPSRIRVDWVGTDQTSTPDPGLCGTSNRSAQKERKGSAVTEADKNRRVEVYLVPKGSQVTPPAAKTLRPLPEDEVKSLGCPK